MSHTDKTDPYWVQLLHEGYVEHDHSAGVCHIEELRGGDSRPSYKRNARRAHLLNDACPANTTYLCVHDAQRDELQRKLDDARHRQRGFYSFYNLDARPPRHQSSAAMREMIEAGYIPNCPESRTHEITVPIFARHAYLRVASASKVMRDFYRMLPGESLECSILPAKGFLSRPCETCDELAAEYPTCTYTLPATNSYWHYRCHCYSDDHSEPSSASVRDTLRNLTRAYNSGNFEDYEDDAALLS